MKEDRRGNGMNPGVDGGADRVERVVRSRVAGGERVRPEILVSQSFSLLLFHSLP